ncbi:TPA: hypothetical protein ACGO62_001136 [Streptococcus suis]
MSRKAALEFAEKHLEDFKKRMHITHTSEDKNFTRILTDCAIAIAVRVGADKFDEDILELVLERALYVCNDALDEFQMAYEDEIETLYLVNMILAREESGDA